MSNSNSSFTFKNNIYYNSSFELDSGYAGSITCDYNDYYSPSNGVIIEWLGTSYTAAQFATFKSSRNQEAHGITSNPLLTSVITTPSTAHDLRPTGSSPTINTGSTLGSPYDNGLTMNDIKSSWPLSVTTVSRPQGSAWDIGAYEYGGGSPNPPPNPPQNLEIMSQ